MRSLFAAMRKGRKRKRGASLAMVLVSMTVLTIMGTLFTTIAMRSYQYSYSRLCRQQAYYTASSSVESFYNYVSSNPNVLSVMITQLNDACEGKVSSDDETQTYATIDPTTVRLKVGSTGGGAMTGDTVSLVPNGFFDLYLGSCTLWVRFNNTDRTEISVEAEATYNGYSETVRAIIARTNGAASELKKIFDNTFCLQSPITTIVAGGTTGDVYVSQPVASTIENPQNDVEKHYNTVLKALLQNGSYTPQGQSPVEGTPGQYLRNANGEIYTAGVMGNYNSYLRDNVYGKAQASTADGKITGHTKPLDMDNTLLTATSIPQPKEGDLWYNDWVELYMFSAVENGTAVEGNLYADSKILIGLLDRDYYGSIYLRSWDNTIKRSVFSYQNNGWTSDPLDNYMNSGAFINLDLGREFEHGFDKDVFFNHEYDPLKIKTSRFRINGDMYLWEDARIENFDSYDTDNVKEGKKNNIYAAKDLYIDGLYIKTGWDTGAIMPTESNTVIIGGDVVVQGNAQIMNANIYGDVYCFGDELTIVSSNIYGNVYFTGSNFTADYMRLFQTTDTEISTDGGTKIPEENINSAKGTYTNGIPDKGNLIINCTTNLNVTGYDPTARFGTKGDVGYSDYEGRLNDGKAYYEEYRWGATLTNCWVLGTIWSNVNTHIMCSKWDDGTGHELPDYYGDIYVSKYLFIDLIWTYEIANQALTQIGAGWDYSQYKFTGLPQRQDKQISSYHANWHGFTEEDAKKLGIKKDEAQAKYDYFADALRFNCFEALDPNTQKIYAERFQFRLNQTDGLDLTQRADVSKLGTVLVGRDGIYVDGNPHIHDKEDYNIWRPTEGDPDDHSIKFENIYSMSSAGQMWEYNVYGDESYDAFEDTVAGNLKPGTNKITTALGDLYKEMMPNGRENVLDDVKNDTFDKNGSVGKVWKEKLIKIRTWSAPVAGNKTEFNLVDGLIVKYVGEDFPEEGGGDSILFGHPNTTDVADYIETYSDAFEVTDNGNTLIISDSVTFNCFADFSAYKRVIFDTSEGNIYVKFLYGAKFGKAQTDTSSPTSSEVVLTGGNMVFWHFYQEGTYDFNNPTLQINPYTNVGIVTASSGAGYGNDGLYIISNDDALITVGYNSTLNTFIYAPHSQVFFAPPQDVDTFTVLNGCMAIESLIMLSDADQQDQTILDEIAEHLPPGLTGIITGGTQQIEDEIIRQYKPFIFNYVQPPLITDSVLMGGLTEQEVTDFNSVVWEFLGYY